MAIPFWDSIDEGNEGELYPTEPWDDLRLNGFRVPGIAIVKCVPRMKIDISKETNRDGGPTIEKGHEPARVDIQVRIWTRQQWLAWQAVSLAVWRRPGQETKYQLTQAGQVVEAKKAVTIDHPACALYGVSSVLLESPESPEIASGVGTVRIKAVQYIAPSKKPATKKAAGAGPPLDPRIQAARNAKRRLPPSVTDAVARPAPAPSGGV